LGYNTTEFDCIIHSAALRPASVCEANYTAAIAVNILATKNMVEYAQKVRAKQFIFFSVQSVYSRHNPLPVSEEGITEGTEMYSITKLAAEMIVSAGLKDKMNFQILRLAHLYGYEGHQFDGVIRAFFDAARYGSLTIQGSGKQSCCFLHIKDLCRLMALMLQKNMASGIFNVCSEVISVSEIAGYFCNFYKKFFNQKLEIYKQDCSTKGYGIDNKKIIQESGWHPVFLVEKELFKLFGAMNGSSGASTH
jgi:UDP-glucose 4-epimerase